MDRLFIGDQEVYLTPGTRIALTMQINDIAELKDRQANFSQQFKIPKTKANREIFENVDIVQSMSRKAYKFLPCKIIKEGIEVIPAGVLVFDNTSTTYNVTAYSGIYDFFGKIDGLFLRDLDLQSYDHIYNKANVIARNNNPDVMYPLINYGLVDGSQNLIDVRQLRPAVNFWVLFREIIKQAGFPYDVPVRIQNYLSQIILPFCKENIIYDPAFILDQQWRARTTTSASQSFTIGQVGGAGHDFGFNFKPDDDTISPNHDVDDVYNPATGKAFIKIKGIYYFYGKVKLFIATHGLPDQSMRVIQTFGSHVWTIGETVTGNNGSTGKVIYTNNNFVTINTLTGADWSTNFNITNQASTYTDSIFNVNAVWDVIYEGMNNILLNVYKNGAYLTSTIISASELVATTKLANPDPDTDTQKKYFVIPFQSAGIHFDYGDLVEFTVTCQATMALQDQFTQPTLALPITSIEWGYEFSAIDDTNFVGCNNVIVSPFTFGSTIHLSDTLPDMTQTDFMKACAQMMGLLFSHNLFTDQMIIRQFNDIIANIPNARDWSGKVDRNELKNIMIDFHSAYGFRNYLKYMSDSDDTLVTAGQADGQFNIDDDTLQKDKDLFELPFAATYDGQYMARALDMPFIKKLEVATPFDYTLSSVQRVLVLDPKAIGTGAGSPTTLRYYDGSTNTDLASGDIVPICYFTRSMKTLNLSFGNTLMQDNYRDIIFLLQNFKKVTLPMKLINEDTYNFDHYIPVYISQLGSYFYVNKIINYTGDGLTKVELIRL